MKIKKKHLEVLGSAIKSVNCDSFKEGRVRDAFYRSLHPFIIAFYSDRAEIFNKLCIKDADGNPVRELGENGKPRMETFKFDVQNQGALNAEMETLVEEEIEIEAYDELKKHLEASEYKPKFGEAELLDEVIAML